LHILSNHNYSKARNTNLTINKICAAGYAEATVEWAEWTVEDSDTGEDSDIS